MSLFSKYLAQDQFCVLFEYLTSKQSQFPLKAQFAGFSCLHDIGGPGAFRLMFLFMDS